MMKCHHVPLHVPLNKQQFPGLFVAFAAYNVGPLKRKRKVGGHNSNNYIMVYGTYNYSEWSLYANLYPPTVVTDLGDARRKAP